jgi:hypothetical protein
MYAHRFGPIPNASPYPEEAAHVVARFPLPSNSHCICTDGHRMYLEDMDSVGLTHPLTHKAGDVRL